MAEENDSSGEKTEEPSQYRIDEFRKRGDVAFSRELNSVLILSASFFALTLSGVYIFETMSEFIYWLYTLPLEAAYSEKILTAIFSKTVTVALKCAAPVLITAMVLGVVSQFIQIGAIFSPEILNANFDRINPLNGIKRIFSIRALTESIKGIFKFAVVIFVTYMVMKNEMGIFNNLFHMEILQGFNFANGLMVKLFFSIILGLGVVATADFAWEKFRYSQKLRQTKQQAKDEMKEKEGNPEIKQRIRNIQKEMAKKRMMKNLKKADVIITNPTHISVAVYYDPKKMLAPEVVAKGADIMAFRIRELAKKYDIPCVENVPLARTLYKTVKVNQGVPRSLYKAVAEILAFVYRLKKKKKALSLE